MHSRQVFLAVTVALAATSVGVAAGSVSSRQQQQPVHGLDQPLDARRLVGRATTTDETLLVRAPGEIEFSILIKPTPHSRELRVVAESGTFYRSTSIELGGADSEPLHSFTWRGLPTRRILDRRAPH